MIGRDAELGQPRIVVLNEDSFLLNALDLNLGDFWDGKEHVAHLIRDVFKLCVAKTLSGNGQDGAEDVAERERYAFALCDPG